MNKEEKELIMRSVVSSFCINSRMFTSVEVANHLKRLGVWIRNRYVAEYLRDNVGSISAEYGVQYARTNINVDSFGTDGKYFNVALCYHPISLDPRTYKSRDLKAITPAEFEARHGVTPFEKKNDIPMHPRNNALHGKPDIIKAQFNFVIE